MFTVLGVSSYRHAFRARGSGQVKFTMPTRIVIPPIQVFELAWLMVGKLMTLFVTTVLATYCIHAKSV